MAYADGELDAQMRVDVEAAMAVDPQIAQEIARHRELRANLRSAFGGVLGETMPEHLLATARTAPASNSSRIAEITEITPATPARRDAIKQRWSWPEWGAIAASLLLGVIAARAPWSTDSAGFIVAENGRMIASGVLASALTRQPGGAHDSPVQIGVSFRAKSGEYCRTFAVREGDTLAGFACRDAENWRVHTLAQSEPGNSGTQYRMAGTAVPPIIVQAVENVMAGDALDAAGEAAALQRGWKSEKKN